jgi:hypothetical protein
VYSVLAVPDEFIQQAQPDMLPPATTQVVVDTTVYETLPPDTVPVGG